MNITVSVVGRSAVDQPFSELVAPAVVALVGPVTGYTPTLPAHAAEQDLRLRVKSNDDVKIVIGAKHDLEAKEDPIAPRNNNGEFIANLPLSMASIVKQVALRGGETRDIPFEAQATFAFRSNRASAA